MEMDDNTYYNSKKQEHQIVNKLNHGDTSDETYSKYYYLPHEIIATNWAIDKIMLDYNRYGLYVRDIANIIKEFYNANLTEGVSI